jgi:hypothetical protein
MSTIHARPRVAVFQLVLAMSADPSVVTHAPVVVHQLHAVLDARTPARVRQAFVDVTLAARSNESRRAHALVSVNPVDASTAMVAWRLATTSVQSAIVFGIDFAQQALGSGRT